MSYTFGGATGDDITWGPAAGSAGGPLTCALVCGWWYPTTLTATRGYWSAGNTVGAEVDTTTSELRLRTDNTTDGQWTTTGAGIVTGKWYFLAFMLTCNNTGPTAAWRVWVGDGEIPPQPVTVTNAVAPVGNFTGSVNYYVGNKGTATLSFQGQIGEVFTVLSDSTASPDKLIPLATAGAITDDEANHAYLKFVEPFWRGNPSGFMFSTNASLGQPEGISHLSLITPFSQAQRISLSAGNHFVAPTVSGATWSSNQPPRYVQPNWIATPQGRRGR